MRRPPIIYHLVRRSSPEIWYCVEPTKKTCECTSLNLLRTASTSVSFVAHISLSFFYTGTYGLSIPKTALDHFDCLHGRMQIPWTTFSVPGMSVVHRPLWQPNDSEPHIAYFIDKPNLAFLGKDIPQSDATATITFFGPGGVVYFTFDIPRVGRIYLFHCHLPLEPMLQRAYFHWYASPSIPAVVVSYVVGSWIGQWGNDLDVWENKTYLSKPFLIPVDGPVAKMRRWYNQFYSPSSKLQIRAIEDEF